MKSKCWFICWFIFGLYSCEGDLDKLKAIKLKKENSVEKTTDVELVYSDSAKVKAKLNTPLLLNFKVDTPYYEMPKGMKVIFYDQNLVQVSSVTSEYAMTQDNQKILELRKNVIAKNNKGETFKSDELIWDQNKRIFYSNKQVSITTNSAQISGTQFWAKEDFSYYQIKQGAGPLMFNEKLAAP